MDAEADEYWMRRALDLAADARAIDEVPVGCVVVRDGATLGEGFNQPISQVDPSAHAEILALRAAATAVANYRLAGATVYVTLEPCAMCAGALVHARIARLVFGAREPKAGAVASQMTLLAESWLNHRVEVASGVLEAECAAMMQQFFRDKRP